ncbi:MAG: pitrilysin family protein [Bacillota bacterium]|nr:pitrilysin family protein [Bacillota bacterium]
MKTNYRLIENKALQESVYHYRINPGMDLYILPRAGYQKKYAIFSTRFGSIDNSFRVEPENEITALPDGVAHFLEHKLFEDEQGNVFDRFAALGASANAFTSFTQTTYLFSCTANFEQNLTELLNFVQDPYFTEETVSKEQGIIGQEIRMYEDHPHWRVFFNLLESLYREHPVRNDIAGTVESISGITPDLLYRCYNTFYHPSNMAVFLVGDLEPDRVAALVEENLSARNYKQMGAIVRYYLEEPEAIMKEKTSQELVVSEPIFYLGFKDNVINKLTGRDLMHRELLMELILDTLFGTSEMLYNDLYKADLIDEGFGFEYAAESTYGYTMIGGETKDPERLHEQIIKEIKKAQKNGISEEQFERHRRKILGSYIRKFDSLEFIANNFLAYKFRDTDLFELPGVLNEVKREEALALIGENLNPDRHAVSLILPLTDG